MFKIYYVLTYPLSLVFMGMIWLYKLTFSKLIGRACRYLPTCSSYALMCVKQFGAIWGGVLAVKRLIRCRPNVAAGVDFPPLNLNGDFKFKM